MRKPALRFATVVLAAIAVLAPGSAAMAAPSPGEIEDQIKGKWAALEPIIEDYNKIHDDVKSNQVKYDALLKTLEPLQLEVDLAMSRITIIATKAYKGGTSSSLRALLSGGSPDTLLDQMSMLNQMSRKELDEIKDVRVVRDKYEGDRKQLDTLLNQLKAQGKDLTARRQTIEAQVNDLQRLRLQAYGTTGTTGALRPVACPYEFVGGAAGAAAERACKQIGKPYSWGADGPSSFDCSGLTAYAWAPSKGLPHSAANQQGSSYVTTFTSRASLRTGDLVFYGTHHVAIYVGGGWMVHAPHTGDVVRMAKIDGPGTPTKFGHIKF